MKEEKNVYQLILEIADIADQIDFERRNEVNRDDNRPRRIINRPKEVRKIPHEAYQKFFEDKKTT